MSNLGYTKEDASEAFFNIGKLCGRISSDEGKRLAMLIQIIASYMEQLEKKEDDFDMDGRC
jgi:hypothetical protein